MIETMKPMKPAAGIEQAAEVGADDAEQDGEDPTHWIRTGFEETRQDTNNRTNDDRIDDAAHIARS